jgi:hypothetical protein
MSLQNYVSLGRSGVRVSPICLGAMTFGEDWVWGSNVEDSKKILDRTSISVATSSTPPTATPKATPKA